MSCMEYANIRYGIKQKLALFGNIIGKRGRDKKKQMLVEDLHSSSSLFCAVPVGVGGHSSLFLTIIRVTDQVCCCLSYVNQTGLNKFFFGIVVSATRRIGSSQNFH